MECFGVLGITQLNTFWSMSAVISFFFFFKSFPLCCTSCQIEVLLLQRTMALSAWLSVHPVFLNSMLIMFTTCQGRQDMIQISAFMLYDA